MLARSSDNCVVACSQLSELIGDASEKTPDGLQRVPLRGHHLRKRVDERLLSETSMQLMEGNTAIRVRAVDETILPHGVGRLDSKSRHIQLCKYGRLKRGPFDRFG